MATTGKATEGILSERIFDNEEQFLVRWGGNYKPSWEPAETIKSDCPALVEEFLKEPPLTRVLKTALAPSSSKMSWEIVAGLLGLVVTQTKWKPPAITTPPPTGRHDIQSFPFFELHSRFVDENYDEAGKLPLLSMLLVEALETYERKGSKEFVIIPQAKTNEYKTDYAIALIEKVAADAGRRVPRYLALYELKKEVSSFLSNVNDKHLAQTLVEGYYTMLGGKCDSIVVALTDIAATHYFKLKLPTTRLSERSCEVVWHHAVVLDKYPLSSKEQLNPFITFVHHVIDELA